MIPCIIFCAFILVSFHKKRLFTFTRAVGTIAGAVVGGLIGLAIIVVIIVVLCGACKTQGNRGTVVRPVNTQTVHTVQSGTTYNGRYIHN